MSALINRQGQPWTKDEDQRLRAAYQAGTTVAELAQIHGRSAGAITSRLDKQATGTGQRAPRPRAADLEQLLTSRNDFGETLTLGQMLHALVHAVDDMTPAVLTIARAIENRPVPDSAAAVMAAREEGYATGYAEGYGKAQAEVLAAGNSGQETAHADSAH